MDEEKRNETSTPSDATAASAGHLPPEQAQGIAPVGGSPRWMPGESNPALTETEGYKEGTISTAEFLQARGSAEAQLPGAMEHRDRGFAARPPHHGHPSPPAGGVTSHEHLYDTEEQHVMHEEPEMHVFAPRMLNIPSEEDEQSR